MNNRFLMLITAFVMVSANLFAQGERKDKTAVTYEEIYDEPYSINKLFVGLMPLYGELFATNVNAGFGLDVHIIIRTSSIFTRSSVKPIALPSSIRPVTRQPHRIKAA